MSVIIIALLISLPQAAVVYVIAASQDTGVLPAFIAGCFLIINTIITIILTNRLSSKSRKRRRKR